MFAKLVVTKVLCGVRQQMKVQRVCPLGHQQYDHITDRISVWSIERDRQRRADIQHQFVKQPTDLPVRNRDALTEPGVDVITTLPPDFIAPPPDEE